MDINGVEVEEHPDGSDKESFLVISNISKRANVKSLVTMAVMFGISNIIIVGQPHFSFDTHTPPIDGLGDKVSFHHLANLTDCREFLQRCGVTLYGVEIVDGATAIENVDFRGHACAFMMGNEGAGMNAPQLAVCDKFIYIPQYGGGTASLNVSNACAIVLQYFALSRISSIF